MRVRVVVLQIEVVEGLYLDIDVRRGDIDRSRRVVGRRRVVDDGAGVKSAADREYGQRERC